ncbi:MAG: bifunctional glutamate N-acetyltransferase/amino-acid acetyltransferase ArgJ [Lentisphaerae bacterium]|nr:bifunctional glutamate N-acetyltransferase/amino-acid acetyltransferase ArgJ [Lentisphaerota bacterium]
MNDLQTIEGGVTAPLGYQAAGVAAHIKVADRKDFALLVSDRTANAAGLFTTNAVAAAPVRLGRERLAAGRLRAIAVNTGYANACTGEIGMANARAMSCLVSDALGIPDAEVLVCSTGVIGMHLPMDRIATGVTRARAALCATAGYDAATAIMTTDTVPKQTAVRFLVDGRHPVTVGGMCKGAGMIEPYLATMLAFITTDAAVAPGDLQTALRQAVETSFNRVVIDNDRSTNDTAVMLANGAAAAPALSPAHPAWPRFTAAVGTVCTELARQMVMDGEGATKFVTVRVTGARSPDDAQLAGRAIARSMLVKTSWFGLDPNWGRVIAAVGYSGAAVDESRARISYGGIAAFDRGRVADAAARDALKAVMSGRAFDVTVDLGLGEGSCTIFTCDLSREYVNINADYTT